MKTPPRFLSVAALAAALLVGGPTAVAAQAAPAPAASAPTVSTATLSADSVGSICYSDLPSQAYDTLDLIASDGPFPYSQDGTVFQNREGILPSEPTGYYHEYTVITPGSPTRGARRIVTGERSQEDYYTSDHYASFDLIDFSC
ncbi:ribonuclease [Streptomyces beihaiensis]|uniref:Ribonuclease n=1 Tax=Streptomyces beihaiensis TaxID=2984495 RepID=A0ABT3U174_9ACTN|nr:ribonuclease [Streptomyces beihaiensis]MCX3063014.1 ribonuclease [Streptomyces beihaiensis]